MSFGNKILKMCGISLITAGLTLGVATPALAEVSLNGGSSSLSSAVVNANGSPRSSELKVPVSFQEDDEVSCAKSVFRTLGSNYMQTLTLIEPDASYLADGVVNAKFDTAKAYGSLLYEGSWKVEDVTVYYGDDEEESASIGKSLTVNDGLEPETDAVVDTVTSNFPEVTVTTKQPVDAVVLYYLSPAHELVTLPIQKENSTTFTGKLTNAKDFVMLNGSYTLQAIMTSDITSDTGDADTAKQYVLETSVIEYRGNVEQVAMLRLYNPNSGEHFYTANEGEKDLLVAAGWRYEGVGFYALTSGKDTYKNMNRLYNGYDHHYAADGEAALLEALGWKNEGVSFYSNEPASGNVFSDAGAFHPQQPIYRLYNPNASVGAHHYTSVAGERDLLVAAGWKDEGVGFYGVDNDKLRNALTQAL